MNNLVRALPILLMSTIAHATSEAIRAAQAACVADEIATRLTAHPTTRSRAEIQISPRGHREGEEDYGRVRVYRKGDEADNIAYTRTNRGLLLMKRDIPPAWTETGPLRDSRLLDIGAGGGAWVKHLRSPENNVHAEGVDIAVTEAELVPELRGHLHEADAADLSRYPDGHFDYVYSIFSVFYYESNPLYLRRCLREAVRVTRSGGTLRIGPAGNIDLLRALLDVTPGIQYREIPRHEAPRTGYFEITKD